MQIILLSGGSGKRLWPLSNDVRSKQFLQLFRSQNGTCESMLQRMYRQICSVAPDAGVTIATGEAQVPLIREQLGADAVGISLEPCRRDTFPAIALASAYLHDRQGVPEDEVVVVCPVDPYVDIEYFKALRKLGGIAAQEGASNLVLMGIEPASPSEKYGYIIPETGEEVSRVRTFKEKPSAALAEQYIAQGALWNGGIFAYRLGYVLRRAHELMSFEDYDDLFGKYATLTKISFDYAVVEHESDISVMRFDGRWMDIGTWDSLTDAIASAETETGGEDVSKAETGGASIASAGAEAGEAAGAGMRAVSEAVAGAAQVSSTGAEKASETGAGDSSANGSAVAKAPVVIDDANGPVVAKAAAVLGDGCKGVSVVSELDIPILCMGLEDVIVAASPDGILITTRSRSGGIKPYVEQLPPQET